MGLFLSGGHDSAQLRWQVTDNLTVIQSVFSNNYEVKLQKELQPL